MGRKEVCGDRLEPELGVREKGRHCWVSEERTVKGVTPLGSRPSLTLSGVSLELPRVGREVWPSARVGRQSP